MIGGPRIGSACERIDVARDRRGVIRKSFADRCDPSAGPWHSIDDGLRFGGIVRESGGLSCRANDGI
jgi:hypothetical protein